MIALPVSLKLAMSRLVTVEDCDTRSDRLRADSVTLRLDAMAEENSTSPKNIVSINGAMNANSIAALARRSRMKRPIRLLGRYESLRMACLVPVLYGSMWKATVAASSRLLLAPVRLMLAVL